MNRAGALRPEQKIAVVGAGAMGRGIAQVAAAAGHQVLLYDAITGVAQKAMEIFRRELDKLVSRNKLSAQDADAIVARIVPVGALDDLAECALAIEVIVENLQVKAELLQKLEGLLGGDSILATNTSSLSVTELGRTLRRPAQFAGMHFFNPATVLPLVEVVQGAATDPAVVACLTATAKAWGKVPVTCRSTPGFIVNRVARPFYGEAMRLLSERAAEAVDIDALMRDSGGFRMGPLELTDLIGQDINFAVTQTVFEGFFGDPRYQPSLVQRELVLAGHLGRKTGRGFYRYVDGVAQTTPAAAALEPKPDTIVVCGSLGPADALAELAQAVGIAVSREAGEGYIRIDELKLFLTDGRLATQRALTEGRVALFDLALDYVQADRIGLTFADQVPAELRCKAIGFFQALGKKVSLVEDVAGLVVMRTVAMLINEAVDAEYLAVASAEDIELAMTMGVNYPIGLLQWCQQLGAHRVLQVMENLARNSSDGRYRASPLLRRRAALENMPSAAIRDNP